MSYLIMAVLGFLAGVAVTVLFGRRIVADIKAELAALESRLKQWLSATLTKV